MYSPTFQIEMIFFLVWISHWNSIEWADVELNIHLLFYFLSISSGMVSRLTPKLQAVLFLDSDAPISAFDLGLMVDLTSWWPDRGRSKVWFSYNGSDWWVGGFCHVNKTCCLGDCRQHTDKADCSLSNPRPSTITKKGDVTVSCTKFWTGKD